jgi:hypothetical protein
MDRDNSQQNNVELLLLIDLEVVFHRSSFVSKVCGQLIGNSNLCSTPYLLFNNVWSFEFSHGTGRCKKTINCHIS